ncbi:hypothetical protein AAZX31_06G087500 [Glycine max]|uniref:Hydroxyproline-rich glycoprotein family protein n=2 Tax=Glycine subgen. Soja TaxID=1462606 RepID=C6T524_SOYBN|nr:uncharacterized protein LOC100527674 [Glycine max]XP_028235605.1 uncharacterized protein At5g65660-like [Glycine soja]ACU16816.1 unknown [Glycine max]KAG5018853.1 hypothetical protein JHK87_014708 [Glycine soja]KAG5031175.1 hypothetical protein JHK85_015157 [Glycine max]KAG5045401.1 hypothetical protein JHK86_014807 [Glycine max]KAG5147909.1 hypothetical protein JHK82_014790 [Glycine max]|eukprot:NP_001235793.1 uncharacterized protein LOC100527674 [Glycine max]
MEIEDTSSRVSIAFPLGLALLVALLLFFCCFFCCCLHWEKLQPLFPFCMVIVDTQPQTQADFTPPPHKPGFPVLMMQHNRGESLPVLMPGDEVPKFIALACPCQPPTNEMITIHVQKTAPNDFCGGA